MKEKVLKKWDLFLISFLSANSSKKCHYLFPMISCFRTSFPVLERPFPVFWFFGKVILSWDVPEQMSLSQYCCSCLCLVTKGQRDKKISLYRDKGTMERPIPVCSGISHRMSCPMETLVQTLYFQSHCYFRIF